MNRYKCKECGYIHIGDEPPAVCPVCGYDSEVFYKMEDSSSSQDNIFYETIDSVEESVLKVLRQRVAELSEMAAVANAMAIQASHENRVEDSDMLKSCSLEFLNQASVSTMLLGELLEFNTDSNKKEIAKKLKKEIDKTSRFEELLKDEGIDDASEIVGKGREVLERIMEAAMK